MSEDWEEDDWENDDDDNQNARKRFDDDDDWDEPTGAPAEPAAPAEPSASSSAEPGSPDKNNAGKYVPLDDPVAEKERLRKLQMESEMDDLADLVGDKFVKKDASSPVAAAPTEKEAEKAVEKAVEKKTEPADLEPEVVVVDAFADFSFDSSQKIEEVVDQVIEKLEKVKALHKFRNSGNKLVTKVLKMCVQGMTVKELAETAKKLKQSITEQKLEAQQKTRQKAFGDVSKNTKFNVQEEWDDVYGRDWDEDEYWEGGY